VPRLVLINGALGSGKSMLVRRYAPDHQLTLALDVEMARAAAPVRAGWSRLVEVVLFSSPEEAATRFARRSDRSTSAEHQDAATLGLLGP
jgi:hypothetical protein